MVLARASFLVLSAWAFALGQVSVQVTPAACVLPAGKRLAFHAVVRGSNQQACVWSLPDLEGELTGEGVFTAPVLAESKVLRVRATTLAEPRTSAEAAVLVLRGDPGLSNLWEMVEKHHGPGLWRPFHPAGLPFMDEETGLRFDPGAVVALRPCSLPLPARQWVGFGLAVPVRWEPVLADADGLMLSLREGGDLLRFNATGQPAQVVQVTGKVQDASLEILRRRGPAWESQVLPLKVQVRGLVPFAGSPAEPGHEDGPGPRARFRKPWGLAMLGRAEDGDLTCVAADAEDHVIRTIAADGGTGTLCGGPGAPGFKDGPGAQARFNGPTFLAAGPAGFDPEAWGFTRAFVVADTGNHAIRWVDALGAVTTLAGDGTPGYVDSADPRQARFNRPLGVAVDADLNVYVADAGNHVIRRIDARGRVTTLAGAGRSGYEDGEGSQARFSDLKGLALVRDVLCAVDGHSIRTVSTLRGWHQVETLLGWPGDPASEVGGILNLEQALGPALNRPCGLASHKGRLLVAEEGNHAVRVIYQDLLYLEYQCLTVAGDPEDPCLRWGLLRDGLPWRPGPGYAALEAPRGVVFSGEGGAYVTTGSGLVHLSGCDAIPPPQRLHKEKDHTGTEETVVRMWHPYRLRTFGPWQQVEAGNALRLTLECLDRDTGCRYKEPVAFDPGGPEPTVTFTRPGRVETRLTLVTERGFTQGFRKHLRVVSE